MRIGGYQVGAGTFIASAGLGTIGQLIYHFDYRFNIIESGATVLTWNDLGHNSLSMQRTAITRSFDLVSDGLSDESLSDTPTLTGANKTALKALHDGSPFLQFIVFHIGSLGGTNISFPITSSASAGAVLQLLGTNGNIRVLINNDAATQIVSNQTANGTVPTGRFILVMHQYYGSGTGSDNRKIIIENVVHNFTSNPTFGTGEAKRIAVLKSTNTSLQFRLKAMGAYNLTGMNTTQIDAFQATFVATLKADAEYAGLTTP